MRRVVDAAENDARAARSDADATVQKDLRRLAGLAPAPEPQASAPDTTGGPYCRLLGRFTRWLLPAEVAAQTPSPSPVIQVPATPARAMPQIPLITPGGTSGEDDRVDGARRRAAVYLVEIHKKLAIAVACFVFALLGVPVALRFPRGGAGLVIGTSVFVFAIYYVGLIGGEDLGDRLIVSPFLSMWGPNLLFGALGLAGLWVMRRASPTARGGDWSDLKEAVIGLLRRRARV
jgi:lipopolysaccharide export system permease protein